VTERAATQPPPLPEYGTGSLAEVIPSILAALGEPGFEDSFGLGELSAVCLFLVDGLGWEPLVRGVPEAPFLSGEAARARSITTGFPSTTVASFGSLGTGLPPGRHGLVGYTLAVSGYDRPMNVLRWTLSGGGPGVDLRNELPPEEFQPEQTLFERAASHGLQTVTLGDPEHARSGLTRATLRGATFMPTYSPGDVAAAAGEELRAGTPFVCAYYPGLDFTGHLRGPNSDAWALELGHVDRIASDIAERLPPGSAMIVTGDHGMIEVLDEHKVEMGSHPELQEGVRLIAGEPRARYVYARPGAESDVLAAWADVLSDRMWVVSREQAIADGWFGPGVPDRVRPRIGDVIAAAREPVAVVKRESDGLMAALIGHHGSLTPMEQLVPLIVVRRD
jgi:predicted AlkP superfamily pyrophosphatase or phosphodiesterase